jgi:hypothetical protein
MMARSVAWKAFEREVATLFGSFRVPLSGINSRHNAGDVILPDDLSMLIECKCRATSIHLTIFRDACRDAVKNGVDPIRTLLFFRQKSHKGYIVTMSGEAFEHIWNVPGVRELFAK